MDPERQREIARKGGRASGGRPQNLEGVDRAAAGRRGGEAVVGKYGPEHMADIGRRGGQASSSNRASGAWGNQAARQPARDAKPQAPPEDA